VLKDNRLLIGLGIGLIIGAILLELMNLALSGVDQDALLNDNILEDRQYTLEELKAIAENLDYNIIEKSVVLYTQSDMDAAIHNAKESTVIDPVVEATEADAPVDKVLIEEKSSNVEKTSYHITIKSGMVTEEVTALLITVGLISEADSFKDELNRRKLNNKIQVGVFEFPTKPSLTELINKITTPQ